MSEPREGGGDPRKTIVVVLEATFPVWGGGGAESQVMNLGRRLVARGYRVEVLVPRVPQGSQLTHELCEGLHVHRLSYPPVRGLGGLIMLAKLAGWLVVHRHRYAVVHAHIANNMAALASVVATLLGKPVYIKLTGMQEMKGGILDARPSRFVRLKQWAMRRATGLQATSTRIAALLVQRGFDARRVLNLPNGVDVARFSRPRDMALRERLCGQARMVALFVGRLAPEKGHEMLLQAWAERLAGCADVKLLLVGDGALKPALQAQAQALGVAEQVVFAGHTDDVAPYVSIADLGVLTSLAEGLSNALLEYMAGALPVIGSRVSGTEDFIVPGSTGWLFEPGDRAGLAAALAAAAALDAAELARLGALARRLIERSASLDAVADRLIDLYGKSGIPNRGVAPQH